MRALRILSGPVRRRSAQARTPWILVALLAVFMVYIIANSGGFGSAAVILISGFALLVASLRNQLRRS
ncbi:MULTISPECIES: hypothetical protein [Sphingosinicellaceae]|uniref:hypothetical protein n=1 Tax=Sphingosinicellaceae TaxID=2820280 RepID=UPI001C1E0A22|nr:MULTISPECIES: hypothetical protein [Polymorphobacter]QYE36065.1 hypothetical protein KZX46_09075 [Polymorphobacter sp. PAMC 29334]UAJ10362.1 hypothetical protein KTC28_00915 [Polymorphobacter megasporae]